MSINSVNNSANYDPYVAAQTAAQAKPATNDQESKTAKADEEAYMVETGKQDYQTDFYSVRSLKADFRKNYNAFQQMVSTLFQSQGMDSDLFFNALLNSKGMGNLRDQIMALEVDAETKAWATEQIGEEGFWGVDQTAGRILDFAKALSGGDPSKIGLLRDAVEKGFSQAGQAWGGDLPGICQDTYDRVMQGFDEWENGGKADEAVEAEA